MQRGIRRFLLSCVSQAMSHLRELCSWGVLRSQPCGAVTIHTDSKLPTVQIKDSGACQVSWVSVSPFAIWWGTPCWETLWERKEGSQESKDVCWKAVSRLSGTLTRLGGGSRAEQKMPPPIIPSAWLPMVHTGEEKPLTQYPSSTFNSTSKLSH